MHRLSTILAFITNKVFIILLIVTTLALAQTVAIAQVITNKEKVKNILSESEVYRTLPENAIYVIKLGDEEEGQKEESVSKTIYEVLEENGFIKAEEINKVIVSVISPDFLQSQTEQLIDNTYSFLDGTNEEIFFAFSLKDRADVAVTEIDTLINNKLASLPVCNFDQIIAQQNQDINILEAVCLPPGVSLQSEIDKFTAELTAKDGIFAQEFTQKDLAISDVDANLAKYVYSSLKSMIWLFWLLFISFSVVIILTSKTLHRGLKSVGIIQIVLGLSLLFGYLFVVNGYNFVDNIVLSGNDMSTKESEALANITGPLFDSFVSQVVSQVTTISLIIIAFGIILFILGIFATKYHIEHLYLPKHKPKEPVSKKPDSVEEAKTQTSSSVDQKLEENINQTKNTK